jgi:3-hydroxy-9,10-secoandrosta-1,3,5(10)-triene-9,17-dione monooxygenase reductase component
MSFSTNRHLIHPTTGATTRHDVDSAPFRAAMGRFPTGVVLLTQGLPDTLEVMTANSFTSVSLQPPLILVTVHSDGRMRSRMDRCETFAIQILHEGQRELARCFARHQRPSGAHATDVLDAVATPIGNVIVPSAIAVFECMPYARYLGGDHTIYLGQVARIHIGADERLPLTFHRGGYTAPRRNT